MNYKLRIASKAIKNIQKHKKSGDNTILRKIADLLEELKKYPREGTGQPEKLTS